MVSPTSRIMLAAAAGTGGLLADDMFKDQHRKKLVAKLRSEMGDLYDLTDDQLNFINKDSWARWTRADASKSEARGFDTEMKRRGRDRFGVPLGTRRNKFTGIAGLLASVLGPSALAYFATKGE